MKYNKIVIKIGTSTLTDKNGNLNQDYIERLAEEVAELKRQGKQIIIVSSGAISAGVARLGLKERPKGIGEKQAMASIGQSLLMGIYDKHFSKYNQTVGQVLLTKDCVTDKIRRENAQNTFNALLSYGVVPIVNENDTIAVDEIKFGDNDTLSAYVSNLVGADLLILLTDVDGLYDKNPNITDARLICKVDEITDIIKANAQGTKTNCGTGGMTTKLSAVEIACKTNTKTVIMNGSKLKKINKILMGEQHGTFFDIK